MHPKDQQGIALIFSLLILSIVTLIGLGITAVITRELRLSQNIGHSVAAFYASESGVERGLYRVKEGKTRDDAVGDVVSDIQAYTSTSFDSGAEYDNEATDFTSTDEVDILENESIQIDYTELNPPWVGAGIDSWEFEWDDVNSTAERLEVTFIGWRETPNFDLTENTFKLIIDTTAGNQKIINSIGPDLDPFRDKFYRVRIKALGSDSVDTTETVKKVKLSAWTLGDGGGVLVNSSTSIVVQATGQKQRFNQSLTAIVPWQTALSGIFDFVLFTEYDLLKNVAVTANPRIYRTGRLEFEEGLNGNYCECGDPSLNGPGDQCPLVAPNLWKGGCDTGRGGAGFNGAFCNVQGGPGNNMCRIHGVDLSGGFSSDPAGLYITPNISSLGIPSGSYYVRIEGEHSVPAPTMIQLDEDIDNLPGQVDATTQAFIPPTNGGSCRFNCLFAQPVKLGLHCNGGDNDGDACMDNGDCPAGTCNDNYQRIYFLSGNGDVTDEVFLDWYSLSSSPLLTGPDDKYCVDLEDADCF
ncbi:pilus assembly PilX N-terminal domain-containing protein [Patescibacteria group bacterium]